MPGRLWSYDRTVERDGTLATPDGRRLAYVERGDDDGAPVVLHHGTPGSRLGTHPDPTVYVGGGSRTTDEMAHNWIAITHLDDAGYAEMVAEREALAQLRNTAGDD